MFEFSADHSSSTASPGATVNLAALNQTAAGFTIVATNTTASVSGSILAHVISWREDGQMPWWDYDLGEGDDAHSWFFWCNHKRRSDGAAWQRACGLNVFPGSTPQDALHV
jgi:hypothetical protein